MSRISNSGTKSKNSKNSCGSSKRGESSTRLYAAYGSNLLIPQMSSRCHDAKVIGTGRIMEYKLVFRYHADIEQHITQSSSDTASGQSKTAWTGQCLKPL